MHDFPVLLHGDHKDCDSSQLFHNNRNYYDHDHGTCGTCPDGSSVKMSGGGQRYHLADCKVVHCDTGYKMNSNNECESCGTLPANASWLPLATGPCQWECDSGFDKFVVDGEDRCVEETLKPSTNDGPSSSSFNDSPGGQALPELLNIFSDFYLDLQNILIN